MLALFLERFHALHALKKKGSLAGIDLREYDALKDRLATALCAAQQGPLRPGQTPRAHFRVPILLHLELALDGIAQSTATMDVSLGGFAALLGTSPQQQTEIAFKLQLGKTETLSGVCDIVGVSGMGARTRTSFRVSRWDRGAAARLEDALFDAVLGRLTQTAAPPVSKRGAPARS